MAEELRPASWSRNWRGNRETWMRAYTKEYADFPVTTYKIGLNGERQLIETTNQ